MAVDPQTVLPLVVQVLPIISAIVGGVWVLRNNLASIKNEFANDMQSLRTELAKATTEVAVLREREDARAEKTDKMWEWWLKAIEHGWIAHIRTVDVEKRSGVDRRAADLG